MFGYLYPLLLKIASANAHLAAQRPEMDPAGPESSHTIRTSRPTRAAPQSCNNSRHLVSHTPERRRPSPSLGESKGEGRLDMAAPNPLPEYVYKILDAPPAEPLPPELPVSELDAKDGFVHLSTAAQVSPPLRPNFLHLFFSWQGPSPASCKGAGPAPCGRTWDLTAPRSPARQASSSMPSPPSGSSRCPWTGCTTRGGKEATHRAAPFRTSTGSWGPPMLTGSES